MKKIQITEDQQRAALRLSIFAIDAIERLMENHPERLRHVAPSGYLQAKDVCRWRGWELPELTALITDIKARARAKGDIYPAEYEPAVMDEVDPELYLALYRAVIRKQEEYVSAILGRGAK